MLEMNHTLKVLRVFSFEGISSTSRRQQRLLAKDASITHVVKRQIFVYDISHYWTVVINFIKERFGVGSNFRNPAIA